MPKDTLYPPPPESGITEIDILPIEIQHTFDSIYTVIKEKRRFMQQESQQPTLESYIHEIPSAHKRSREQLDLLYMDSILEEKKLEEEDRKISHTISSNTCASNISSSSHPMQDMDMRHFEAAVKAAVLIDKEIKRWERGVSELENILFDRHDYGDDDNDTNEILDDLDIPLPLLVPAVENTVESILDGPL